MKKFHHVTSLILIVLFFATTILLFLRLFEIRKQKIVSILSLDLVRAERLLVDNFNHTGSLIKNINMQIIKSSFDKNRINQILFKFKTNPVLSETFSWTFFSWADKNDDIIVDAEFGILKNLINISSRDYIKLAKNIDNVFYIGMPVIGSTSQKWMIPGGVGVFNKKGNYQGSTVIGFEIEILAKLIQKNIINPNVRVLVYKSTGYIPILLSSVNKILFNRYEDLHFDDKIYEYVKTSFDDNQVKSHIELIFDNKVFLVKKISEYDLTIAVEYDSNAIRSELWNSIWSRSIEFIVIAVICCVIIVLIYKKENFEKNTIISLKEMAEKNSNEKTNLMRVISHDLRNYISSIYSLSDLILTDNSKNNNEKLNSFLKCCKIIKFQSNEMLNFVHDLLDVNCIEKASINLGRLEYCDVVKIIDRMIYLNNNLSKSYSLKIVKTIDEVIPKLKCDRVKFKQILDNIFTNSIKYTNQNGEINITVKYLKDSSQIYIEIADNGIGMDEIEVDEALKGNAHKIDKNHFSKKFDSHGIGLPLVKKLVELHNGIIVIESQKNVGTKVKLWFKLEGDIVFPEKNLINCELSNIFNDDDCHIKQEDKRKILIADDEEINILVFKQILRKTKYQIISAKNGLEAINLVKENKFDLIVLDIRMPQMDGLVASKIIKQHFTEINSSVPIIVVSADDSIDVKQQIIELEINYFLNKPYTKEMVFNLLKEIFNIK
ncbi:MAG: response regulator [Alphaproteobacteria bacterium]